MGKINQIENSLLTIEGGKFQTICNAYLSARGFNINALGAVAGTDKTKIGTPDCFINLNDGNFIFVEQTTQQSGLVEKFKNDIQKCLNTEKTNIPLEKISRIILFYNARQGLSPSDIQQLHAASNGIAIEIHGLNSLSNDLYNDHRNIVRDELGILLDTGQILPPDEFIKKCEKDKLSTPLSNTFLHREQELTILTEKLKSHNLLLVSGAAGVGKTKLALEALKQYQENNSDKAIYIHCIKSHGESLYEDIRDCCRKKGEHIFFVDDANRTQDAQFIFELTQSETNNNAIKVVATVRDYALKNVSEKSKGIDLVDEIIIKSFDEKELSKLLETTYEIRNFDYLDRIWDISQGNPRIALMAGEIAHRENTLSSLSDLEAIYDHYFSKVIGDLEDLKNNNILKVAGIISFFRNIDLEHQEQMDLITKIFDITKSDFSEIAFKLRDMELVDTHDKIIKISDQVLATYFFYLTVFKKQIIDFSVFLNNLFFLYPNKFRDSLYPCLNTFDMAGVREKIEPSISVLWHELEEKNDFSSLETLIEHFAFLRKQKVLVYLKNQIEKTDQKSVGLDDIDFSIATNSIQDFILTTLAKFALISTTIDEINNAIELILDYLEKRPDLTPTILRLLTDEYGIQKRSYREGFIVQTKIFEAINKRISDKNNHDFYTYVVLSLATNFLKTKHSYTHSKSARTVTWGTFEIPFDKYALKLRKLIWECLLPLKEFIGRTTILETYLKIYDISDKKFLAYDAKFLCSNLYKNYGESILKEVILLNQFLDKLDNYDLEYDNHLRLVINSKTFELLKLLTRDTYDSFNIKYEEVQALKKRKIETFVANQTSFDSIYEQLLEVENAIKTSHELWEYTQGLNLFYKTLSKQKPDQFLTLIKTHLIEDNFLSINKYQIVQDLLHILSEEELLKLLDEYAISDKTEWHLFVFANISEDNCTKKHAEKLLDLYKNDNATTYNLSLDFLSKFKKFHESLLEEIVATIIDTNKNNGTVPWLSLSSLFGLGASEYEILEGTFLDNFGLLKEAYFLHLNRGGGNGVYHHPADLQYMLEREPSFLLSCIDYVFDFFDSPSPHNDNTNYSFLWIRDDYFTLMTELFMYLYHKEDKSFGKPYILTFFKEKDEVDEYVIEKQNIFLNKLLQDHSDDTEITSYLFNIIDGFSEERRLYFIQNLINLKPSFDTFKTIALLPTTHTWSGSLIPQLYDELEFLKNIREKLTGIQFLEHQEYLEELIIYQKQKISSQKRREFVDDF